MLRNPKLKKTKLLNKIIDQSLNIHQKLKHLVYFVIKNEKLPQDTLSSECDSFFNSNFYKLRALKETEDSATFKQQLTKLKN
ncbi:hypothetical protein DOS84_06660 [Flavobacterium aquariorum]|uniref:Uncharacterized protein n=1 Tax=Flavobacterium aquariorum TaxID=2217670 RepID=A0A2W7TZN5_9FLAO|nr:hypothetical protein DOS84_06660 [Flavobacterium aquariorum]